MTSKRREKFDKARKNEFLKLLRNGIRRSAACRKVGISRFTFNYHLNKYSSFAEDVLQAELDCNELIEQSLFKQGIEGNVRACEFWLINREPDRWKDKKSVDQQVSGPGGGPVEVINTANLTHDEKKQMLELIRKTRRDDTSTTDPNRDPAEP